MKKQSNFRIVRCLFRDEGVVLEQKYTSMTPIIYFQAVFKSVYLRDPVDSHPLQIDLLSLLFTMTTTFEFQGLKEPKERFFGDTL